MSNPKTDDSGSMKRSFSEMQKNETVEKSSCTLPAAFRVGYFIAIRGERGTAIEQKESMKPTSHQSCCVFGCWNDAQIHLKQMKMEGRKVDYDAFEKIEDATQYAFGKNENENQTSDINAIDSISPFIGAYRKRQVELQGSLCSDAPLSGLEELPHDVLMNIYRYLYSGSNRIADINRHVSVIGMVSKHIFQSCVRYVQHEPVQHEPLYARQINEISVHSIKSLAFFLGNAAKVKDMCIRNHCLSESTFMSWIRLKAFDLSALESLKILDYSIGAAPISAKDKWELVEDGIVSISFVKELCKKSGDDINREYSKFFAASGVPSLQRIEMYLSPNSFEIYNSLFLCAIDRLVELYFNFHSNSILDDNYFAKDKKAALKRIEQLVGIAPRLRKLTLHSGWGQGNTILDFKIQSESLQKLNLMKGGIGPTIQALDVNCPALTTLRMLIVPEVFDVNQFFRSKSCGVIECMRITFVSLHGDYSEEASITGKQVLKMMGKMSSLEDLHLNGDLHIVFADTDLPLSDRLVSNSASLGNIIDKGSSLKSLRMDMDYLFNFNHFQLNLENIENLEIDVWSEEESDEEIDEEDTKLVALSQTIEQRMPKLENFGLEFMHRTEEMAFVLKSESLKTATILSNEQEFSDIQLDCPSLEKLNGSKP